MSRNFELLQLAEREHEVFSGPRSRAAPTKGRKADIDLEAVVDEEGSNVIRRRHALRVSDAPQAEREGRVFVRPRSRVAVTNGRRGELDLEAMARGEAIKLVQRVFLLPGADAPRMVLFCGVGRGDGSSWVCLRASETLASQVKASVCVVDANLHAPFLHEYFRKSNSKGLAEAVRGSGPISNYAQLLNGGNLWVITCGSRTTDPHTLLTSDRLPARLAELRTVFDYVLIDAPPVNLYGDATLLGRLADGVVLVVQANSTHREVVRKAKESLESAKLRVLGAVLNKRTFPIPDSWYRKL
jgi:capsular exopolysaccharide synthesis family protein